MDHTFFLIMLCRWGKNQRAVWLLVPPVPGMPWFSVAVRLGNCSAEHMENVCQATRGFNHELLVNEQIATWRSNIWVIHIWLIYG